jgi:hypothetical protein
MDFGNNEIFNDYSINDDSGKKINYISEYSANCTVMGSSNRIEKDSYRVILTGINNTISEESDYTGSNDSLIGGGNNIIKKADRSLIIGHDMQVGSSDTSGIFGANHRIGNNHNPGDGYI